MKRLGILSLALCLPIALGCGKEDLNKDLKPTPPGTPPPGQAGTFKAGDGNAEKTTPLIKK